MKHQQDFLDAPIVIRIGGNMTEEYQAPLPAKDRTLSEIPAGRSRSKVVATIVDYNHPSLTINDGSDQILVTIPGFVHFQFEDLKIGNMGRFLIDKEESEEGYVLRILAFHSMSVEQVNKYKQLVKLERSESK